MDFGHPEGKSVIKSSRFNPVNGWFAQKGTSDSLELVTFFSWEESSPNNFIMKGTLCEDLYPEMWLKTLSHMYLLWFSRYIHPSSWARAAVLALTYIIDTFSLLEFAGRRDRFYFWQCCCSWMLLLRGTTYKKASPINLSHRFVISALGVLLLIFVGLFLFLHLPLVFGGWWSVVLASCVWCNCPRIFSSRQSFSETASHSPNDLMLKMDVKA